jgi:hypothetical protein
MGEKEVGLEPNYRSGDEKLEKQFHLLLDKLMTKKRKIERRYGDNKISYQLVEHEQEKESVLTTTSVIR